MIWGAFALLLLLVIAATLYVVKLLDRIGVWLEALEKMLDCQRLSDPQHAAMAALTKTAGFVELYLEELTRLQRQRSGSDLLPLPACKCGSTALLLLNGYQRTRIVACQECAKVFGVNSDGVRFERDPEAIPEYATQKAAREMIRSEMKQMEAKSRPERRPGREPLERPNP